MTSAGTGIGTGSRGQVKCVVWDLDDTLWDGVLLEQDTVRLRTDVLDVLRRLDGMGVLHSIASRNDHDAAWSRLVDLGVAEYFLHPQIGWEPKSVAVGRIATALNVGTDALAFVDDQPFERAEVAHAHPGVVCLDPQEALQAATDPRFVPRFVTPESRFRREMYRNQAERDSQQREFTGPPEEFLESLDMRFHIRRATEDDLQRAEELTVRTNQLNSTGRGYSYEQLDALRTSPDHRLIVADLTDRFGTYGTIGLALVECGADPWRLRLLLMSCRTMSRGVGTILLHRIMASAHEAGVRLRADLVETGRNRMMQITYAFAGFREVAREGPVVELQADLRALQGPPAYVELVVGDGA